MKNNKGENMPSTEDIYGGSFLNAKTVKSQALANKTYTIKKTRVEEFKSEQMKVVIEFVEPVKDLALNKTNATILSDSFGSDYTAWVGKKISIILTMIPFQGNMVDSILVVAQGE